MVLISFARGVESKTSPPCRAAKKARAGVDCSNIRALTSTLVSKTARILLFEQIVEDFGPRSLNAVILPHWTVGHVVAVPGGAFPSYAQGYYPRHNSFYKQWDEIARERDSFLAWMKENVLEKGPEAFAQYARKLRAAAE